MARRKRLHNLVLTPAEYRTVSRARPPKKMTLVKEHKRRYSGSRNSQTRKNDTINTFAYRWCSMVDRSTLTTSDVYHIDRLIALLDDTVKELTG